MTDKHLGDSIHDLLDGRLNNAQSQAAMAHLETCEQCNARWQELRAAREALNTSSAGIDMRFAQMLLDKDRMAEIAKGESKHRARAARGRDRRPASIVVAVAAIAFIVVGAAYVAGAPATVQPDFAASPAYGATGRMGTETAAVDSHSPWVHPNWQDSGLVSVGARIERHGGVDVLVATLLVGRDPVVITEQEGRLAAVIVENAPRLTVNGVDAYVVSSVPVQVVWQAGPVVVAATCECAVDTLVTVVAAFPQAENPNAFDRVVDGFGVLAGAMTGK